VRGGERYEMETEITSLEPNALLAVKIVSSGFDVGGRYDLTEQGGKTRLRYVGVARYKTTLSRLMEPVITPAAQKQLEQNLATLKRLVEGAP
jgi:hypothetical protein